MKNKIEYSFKKGEYISVDEEYHTPIPFNYLKTLTELLDEYYSGGLDDEDIIKVILELEPQYEATIVADGIHIILKDIKITIEEL